MSEPVSAKALTGAFGRGVRRGRIVRPPGPPDEVTMDQIRADPLGFLEDMARRYGPVSYHRTREDHVYMIHDPDLIGSALLRGEESFTKEGTPDDLMLTPLLGEGLLTSHGEEWRHQRELTTPMFHRRRIEAFAPMMVDQASRLAEGWEAAARDHKPVRVDHDLTGMTLTIVARAVVGGDLSGIGRGFGAAVDAVNAFLSHGDPEDTPDTEEVRSDAAAFPKAAATLDGIVRLLVAGRYATASSDDASDDLLGALLEAAPDASEPAVAEKAIRDQVMTMIMAGHETTAKALTWALHLLDRNADARMSLQEELDHVLGERDPTLADLQHLPYCRAVVQETLRLYPPIWVISRRATRDEKLDHYLIPEGSLVCVSPWVVHHSEELWPEASRFDPNRFLDGPPSSGAFSYIPFGAGGRQCIGRGFALMEAVLVLATLCRRLEMTELPGQDLRPEALVTLRPRGGLTMIPKSR